jgi:hypothetical protein
MRFHNATTQTVRLLKVLDSAGIRDEAHADQIGPDQRVDINLNAGTYLVEAYVGSVVPNALLRDVPPDSYVRLTLGNEYDLNIIQEQELGPNC